MMGPLPACPPGQLLMAPGTVLRPLLPSASYGALCPPPSVLRAPDLTLGSGVFCLWGAPLGDKQGGASIAILDTFFSCRCQGWPCAHVPAPTAARPVEEAGCGSQEPAAAPTCSFPGELLGTTVFLVLSGTLTCMTSCSAKDLEVVLPFPLFGAWPWVSVRCCLRHHPSQGLQTAPAASGCLPWSLHGQ